MKFYSGLQWIPSFKSVPNKALIDFVLNIPIKFDGVILLIVYSLFIMQKSFKQL